MNITLATIMTVIGTIDQHYTTHTCTCTYQCLLHCPHSQYRILSTNLSQTVARKICLLVTIRIGMNIMAEGDEYLDYCKKPWSASLGVFFKTKWRVLNALKLPHRTGRGEDG